MPKREHIPSLRKQIADLDVKIQALDATAGDKVFTAEQLKEFEQAVADRKAGKARLEQALEVERQAAEAVVPVADFDPANPPTPVAPVQATIGEANALKEKGIKFARCVRSVLGAAFKKVTRAAWYEKEYGAKDEVHAALQASDAEGGGFIVPAPFTIEVIELLRPASVVRKLGAQSRPLVNGKFVQARVASGSVFSYVGENVETNATGPTFGDLELVARTLTGVIPISIDLINFSPIGVDQMVREDGIAGLATKEDLTFIRSNGTGATPKGLRYWAPSANVLAMTASPDLAKTRKDLSRLRLALKTANVAFRRPGFILSARTEEYLMSLVDGNGNLAFPEMAQGRIGAIPYGMSTQIPENLGGGTETELYLADFFEAIIAEIDGIEIAASTEASYKDENGTLVSAFAKRQALLRLTAQHDFGMRHAAGVAVLTGVTWTPGS